MEEELKTTEQLLTASPHQLRQVNGAQKSMPADLQDNFLVAFRQADCRRLGDPPESRKTNMFHQAILPQPLAPQFTADCP